MAIFSFTVKKLKSRMPMGLPRSNPKNTPKNTGLETMARTSPPRKLTSALVSANRGSTAKYTHGYSICSKRVAGGTT